MPGGPSMRGEGDEMRWSPDGRCTGCGGGGEVVEIDSMMPILEASEARMRDQGSFYGNRQQRRRAARHERKLRRREPAVADSKGAM